MGDFSARDLMNLELFPLEEPQPERHQQPLMRVAVGTERGVGLAPSFQAWPGGVALRNLSRFRSAQQPRRAPWKPSGCGCW